MKLDILDTYFVREQNKLVDFGATTDFFQRNSPPLELPHW